MKKIYLLFAMLMMTVSGAWADAKTDFVSVVNAIDGSANLTNSSRSTTMTDGAVMTFALSAGNLFALDVATTSWTNSVAVTELNSVLGKSLTADNYFPKSAANRNGQAGRTATATANVSDAAGYDASKDVTLYVAFYAQTDNSSSIAVSGFSSATYSYALAGGTDFVSAASVSDITCGSQDYTLVKITGKLTAGTASVTMTPASSARAGIQWFAVQYEASSTVENKYVIKMGDKQIASYTHQDAIGAAPAGFSAPSYVQIDETDAPTTCTSTASTFTYKVSYTDAFPFKTDGTKYSLTIRDDKTPQWSIYVDPAATTAVKSIQSTATNYTTPTAENYDYFNWTFEGDWYNGFNIKNAKTNTYLTYGTSASPADNTAATITETLNDGAYFIMTYTNSRYCFKIKGTTNSTFINKRGDNLGTWASTAADGETGSAIKFCASIYIADNQVLVDAIAAAQKYTIGTNYGQYTGLTADELSTAITTAQGYLTSTDKTEIENAAAALNTEVAKLTINLPKAGDCLRIKGTTNATYVGSGLASNSKYSRTEDATESVFFFDGTTLKNISSGNYVAVTSKSWTWATTAEDAKTIVFGSSQIGKYTVKSDDIYLYDADGYVDRGQNPDLTAENQYDTWNLEKAENFVSANMFIRAELGCATFCAPFEVSIPDGVKAYTTYDANTWVGLTEITDGKIPAETPVVVYGEPDEDMEFYFTGAPSANTTCIDGVLTGNIGTEKSKVETGKYLLQNQTSGTGWYEVTTAGLYIGVNRCVMNGVTPVNGGKARAFVPMATSETTGINDIATEAATKADGKYLVNGQIVVVKAGKAYNMGGSIVK